MSDPIDLVLVGCGLMGRRHLRGYREAESAFPGSLRLRAVCDPRKDHGEAAADEAESLLGYRPTIYTEVGEIVAGSVPVIAADVVTDNRSHPEVAIALLEHGVDVQLEKPLAVSMVDATRIVDTAEGRGRVLAVGENNRRDPLNRLLAYLINAGTIGAPQFFTQYSAADRRSVVGSPWRHTWEQGGLALDIGIHIGYILESAVGDIDTISATSRRAIGTRDWSDDEGVACAVTVECDDIYAAYVTCTNGALGSWSMNFAAPPGPPRWQRTIYGDLGSIEAPPDRSGQPIRLHLGEKTLTGDELAAVVPGFELSEVESALFGRRPFSYSVDRAVTDRKLIAAELLDFLRAVREGSKPEVTGQLALRSLAVALSLLESSYAHAPVRVEDVINKRVRGFQDQHVPSTHK